MALFDVRLPGIDGLTATRRIRAAEAARGRPRVPIVALSASALEHERGEILAAGCDDFVAKPFRDATIFAKLREHAHVRFAYEEAAAAPPAAPAREPVREALAGPVHVLLVDDDLICREVATSLLSDEGARVTAVASGEEALRALESQRFGLVFMDLQMPGMDGVETTRRIRADARWSTLPVIAMTADEFAGEKDRFATTGMDGYVGKPVEAAALQDALARWAAHR